MSSDGLDIRDRMKRYEKVTRTMLPRRIPVILRVDGRAFSMPQDEVENYFIWRQIDATRNAIQMAAREYYSHKELNQKSCNYKYAKAVKNRDRWDGLNREAILVALKLELKRGANYSHE